ncbi:MAG TPA: alpha/beta fold hydrolase [Acidimicrobiales bacterium]|nr:alpha/beta fold hydrolase [Acidimicrobiales bacterium]
MTAPIIPSAEPWSFSADGGPDAAGALVVHGFTGNPASMRSLASAFAAAGFSVSLPLLPGHGTAVEDMLPTRWSDWSSAVEAAYVELAGRCSRVVVAGLSMGGTLTCWLAASHPEIAGIVCVNPAVDPPAPSFVEMLTATLEAGVDRIPGIGSDIAKPGVTESAYEGTPIAPLLSLLEAEAELVGRLGDIRCPLLLFTSRQDHVVPPESSDVLAAAVSGPVERVWLEQSYHVATMDFDQPEIETRAVDFARKATAS